MPRLQLLGTTMCELEGEYEGKVLEFTWGRLRIAITIAWWQA